MRRENYGSSIRTPQWEDFVALAVTEVRLFGAASIQVPRRLRAMLEHLIAVLPEARAPALRQELALLESAVERDYRDAEDRRRAQTGDRQGIGGSSSRRGRGVVAFNTFNPLHQRLIDDRMLHVVLVLMLITATLGPVLTQYVAPYMLDDSPAKEALNA